MISEHWTRSFLNIIDKIVEEQRAPNDQEYKTLVDNLMLAHNNGPSPQQRFDEHMRNHTREAERFEEHMRNYMREDEDESEDESEYYNNDSDDSKDEEDVCIGKFKSREALEFTDTYNRLNAMVIRHFVHGEGNVDYFKQVCDRHIGNLDGFELTYEDGRLTCTYDKQQLGLIGVQRIARQFYLSFGPHMDHFPYYTSGPI